MRASSAWPTVMLMSERIDMTGRRFGRLLVIQVHGKSRHGHIRWECRCDCGKTTVVEGAALRVGDTKSCGCARPRRQPKPPRLGTLLYGYRWTEAGVIVDELAALQVRQIDASERQGMTLKAIAQTMNGEYPRADGKTWTIDKIVRVIGSRHLYRGGRRGKHDSTWPTILDIDERDGS